MKLSDVNKNDIGIRLKGKSIYLRSSTIDEIAIAYNWFLDANAQSYSVSALPLTSLDNYANELYNSNHTDTSVLSIVNTKTDEMIGLIRFFNWNNHNRSTEVEILIGTEFRKKGLGREALSLLCKHLFETRGLNKIIIQTAEANIPLVALLDKTGFKRDGVLRRHYFSEGEYHDGILFTLLRFEAPM